MKPAGPLFALIATSGCMASPESAHPLDTTYLAEAAAIDVSNVFSAGEAGTYSIEEERANRRADREASARWWIVAVSTSSVHYVERQQGMVREGPTEAWGQVVEPGSSGGPRRTMLNTLFNCSERTYTITYIAEFNEDGESLSSGAVQRAAARVIPDTEGEGAYNYVCRPGDRLLWPIPAAGDVVTIADKVMALLAMGEDATTAAILGSLDPLLDREQAEYILRNTVNQRNRDAAARLILGGPLV